MKQYLKIFFATIFLLVTFDYTKAQIINTIAGNGSASYCGDGGAATNACIDSQWDIAVDKKGNVYIGDRWSNRIRKVDNLGNITTFAGTGTAGYNGDNIPATSAMLSYCPGVAVDNIGNVYIGDGQNHRVRKVDTSGIITTILGTGVSGYNGDNGQATAAQIDGVIAIAIDNSGNIYINDDSYSVIRKIATTGIITTIAGTGVAGFNGDGGAATAAQLYGANCLTVDSSGNIYTVSTDGTTYSKIRKINTMGIINTIAGDSMGYSGDGGFAINAKIFGGGLTVDKLGNLYFADVANYRIRRIDVNTGIITTVVGNGLQGFSGDGGSPLSAELNNPYSVIFDYYGSLYISDTGNDRIRKVDNTVGIQQFKNDLQLTVYPNPNNGNFTIETNYTTEKQSLQLFDVTGKMVLSQTLNNKANINASSLDNGVYFLQVKTNQNISTQKVIVQH